MDNFSTQNSLPLSAYLFEKILSALTKPSNEIMTLDRIKNIIEIHEYGLLPLLITQKISLSYWKSAKYLEQSINFQTIAQNIDRFFGLKLQKLNQDHNRIDISLSIGDLIFLLKKEYLFDLLADRAAEYLLINKDTFNSFMIILEDLLKQVFSLEPMNTSSLSDHILMHFLKPDFMTSINEISTQKNTRKLSKWINNQIQILSHVSKEFRNFSWSPYLIAEMGTSSQIKNTFSKYDQLMDRDALFHRPLLHSLLLNEENGEAARHWMIALKKSTHDPQELYPDFFQQNIFDALFSKEHLINFVEKLNHLRNTDLFVSSKTTLWNILCFGQDDSIYPSLSKYPHLLLLNTMISLEKPNLMHKNDQKICYFNLTEPQKSLIEVLNAWLCQQGLYRYVFDILDTQIFPRIYSMLLKDEPTQIVNTVILNRSLDIKNTISAFTNSFSTGYEILFFLWITWLDHQKLNKIPLHHGFLHEKFHVYLIGVKAIQDQIHQTLLKRRKLPAHLPELESKINDGLINYFYLLMNLTHTFSKKSSQGINVLTRIFSFIEQLSHVYYAPSNHFSMTQFTVSLNMMKSILHTRCLREHVGLDILFSEFLKLFLLQTQRHQDRLIQLIDQELASPQSIIESFLRNAVRRLENHILILDFHVLHLLEQFIQTIIENPGLVNHIDYERLLEKWKLSFEEFVANWNQESSIHAEQKIDNLDPHSVLNQQLQEFAKNIDHRLNCLKLVRSRGPSIVSQDDPGPTDMNDYEDLLNEPILEIAIPTQSSQNDPILFSPTPPSSLLFNATSSTPPLKKRRIDH